MQRAGSPHGGRQFCVGFFTALCLCSVTLNISRWLSEPIREPQVDPSNIFFPCSHNAFPMIGDRSVYHVMKALPPPADCKVNGFVIEELEPELNFRRAFTLGHMSTLEDRTQLLPYMRATQDLAMHQSGRRILLDLGSGTFESSVEWFLRWYPLDFTAVHAFEDAPGRCATPMPQGEPLADLYEQLREKDNFTHWGRVPLPDWALSRVFVHEDFVSAKNSSVSSKVTPRSNITKFILEDLQVTEEDTVICKMDLEGEEWGILKEWAEIPDFAFIVDEIWVRVHYNDSTMAAFNWNRFEHTRDEATALLASMRKKGFFIHYWP